MPKDVLVPKRRFLRLLDYIERLGLDVPEMLKPLGMDRAWLERLPDDHQLPSSDYSRAYIQAVVQMQRLNRPIPWASGLGSEAYAVMCHCAIGGATLGAALELAQRYDQLMYPLIGYRMSIEQHGEQAELHYQVRIDPEGSVFAPADWEWTEHLETVSHGSGMLVWFGFSGWLIGRTLELTEVHLTGAPVSDAYQDGLQSVFACPVLFEQEHNKLVFPAEYLERRVVHTADSLDGFLSNAVYSLISFNSVPASTSAAIRSLIKRDFESGIASFEKMAETLHMSESSLRRRLLKENTSYQNIKDQVRCEIAISHLRKEDTRINDLAELLGFTEPSSFVRSFRGWMGMTPKAYRDSLLDS
jgi:AraC-like DNA-binding protein